MQTVEKGSLPERAVRKATGLNRITNGRAAGLPMECGV